jgi:hypothetical protein
MRLDQPDPAPIPAVWVVTIKGLGLLLVIAALIGALRSAFERGDQRALATQPDTGQT